MTRPSQTERSAEDLALDKKLAEIGALHTIRPMTFRYWLEYFGAWLLFKFFGCLSPEKASDLGAKLMGLIGPKLGAHKKAVRNIRRAFPEKSETDQQAIAAGMWQNLGRVIAEYPHLETLWNNGYIELPDNLQEVADRMKQGGVFAGGHLSNWELPTGAAQRVGLDIGGIYRSPNNKKVDELILKARQPLSRWLFPKGRHGSKQTLLAMRAGKTLGILFDQKMKKGVPVPFFGADANTPAGAVELPMRYNKPVQSIRVRRVKSCYYKFETGVFLSPQKDDVLEPAKSLTALNDQLEAWIRETPEQWLWLHDRWNK